ncbi:LysE family translocator [Anaeroselena agilis]|uniref:LysE family translocator n=1 Tax=Anaeroselena agilis TaxID=3063788 RepID=A0ABU3NXR4_9FIRM|nr:LysE family translocator [Selenomonadales bacterium 4137-cl]
MLAFLLAGASLGLSAGLSPGPLFALVIAQTVKYGRREGIKAACSPLVTDLPVIVAAVWLLSAVAAYKHILGLIALAGGLFVAHMAWENARSGPPPADADTAVAANSVFRGAVVNLLSPHPYLFWLTVGGPLLLGGWRESPANAVAFLAGFYASLVGAKILLAYLVAKSRHAFTGPRYTLVMRALAGLLFVLAVCLFYEGWQLLS